MSVTPPGAWMLADAAAPGPWSKCTGVVASAYSPVPGISATPRSEPGRSGTSSSMLRQAGRSTSKVNCGTRLPKGPRSKSSITT